MKGRTVLSCAVALGLIAGCTKGSRSSPGAIGASSPAQGGATSILFTAVPASGVFTLSVPITSMQLRDVTGALTADLLHAPRRVELARLEGLRRFFARLDVPPGTYDAAIIGFDGSQARIHDRRGRLSPNVSVLGTSAVVPLDNPMVVASGSAQTVEVTWDLFNGMSVAGPGQSAITPRGSATVLPVSAGIEEIRGRVVSVHAGQSTVDVSWTGSNSPVRAHLDNPVSLLDSFGSPFAGKQSFLASLAAGQTIELGGWLQTDGSLEVSAAEMQGNYAEVEATLVSVDLARRELRWLQRAVEYAAGTPWPGSGDSLLREAPMVPGLAVQDKTTGATLEASDLQPGMTADLILESIGTGWRVAGAELNRFEQSMSGRIVRVGNSSEMVVALDPDDPMVQGNWVSGQVQVVMDQASIRLSMLGRPAVAISDLVPGTRVHLRGWLTRGGRPGIEAATLPPSPSALAGVPGAETPPGLHPAVPHVFDAYEVNVDPGMIQGAVTSMQPTGTLSLFVQQRGIPFGPPLGGIVVMATIDPSATIEDSQGTALSFQDLYQAWLSMPANQDLSLTLRGHLDASGSVVVHDAAFALVDGATSLHAPDGSEPPEGNPLPPSPGPESTFPGGSSDSASATPRNIGGGGPPPGKGGPVGGGDQPRMPPMSGDHRGVLDDGNAPRPTPPNHGRPGEGDPAGDRPIVIVDPYFPFQVGMQPRPQA